MLTFGQSIVLAIISSGIAATIVGGFFAYFVDKRLDRHQRTMEMRKKIYSDAHEELAGLFSNATSDDRQKASHALLSLNRQVQLWASSDVVKQFNKLWDALDKKNEAAQAAIDLEYTNLIIAMRKDLVGENIDKEAIRRYGKIS